MMDSGRSGNRVEKIAKRRDEESRQVPQIQFQRVEEARRGEADAQ